MNIDVQFDARRATASLRALQRGIEDRAIARALNRTATTVRAEAARSISQRLGRIKIGEVRKAIRIERATRGKLIAVVAAGGRRRLPLTLFGAHQTKGGVKVRVLGQTYNIPHAFIRRRGSREAVRIRAPGFRSQLVDAVEFRGKRVQRGGPDYPIAEIMAPGVPVIFVEHQIQTALANRARTRFREAIQQEVRFELARAR